MMTKRTQALLLCAILASAACGGTADPAASDRGYPTPDGTSSLPAPGSPNAPSSPSGTSDPSDTIIFGDVLAPDWNADWSWSTTLTRDSALKKSGAASALVDITASYGGLSIHRESGPLALAGITSLSFDIDPGADVARVAALSLSLQDGGTLGTPVTLGAVAQPAFAPDTWSRVTVPISALAGDLSTLSRVNLQDGAGQGGVRFRLDNLVLRGGAPPAETTLPSKPLSPPRNTPFTIESGTTNWVTVPASYDGSHRTPMTLFVWLHGCGGRSDGDIWTVSPGGAAQTWIALAPGGREYVEDQESGCWDMASDPARILAAIAELKTHFNIKSHAVILGGYSSGGDLAYRTAFFNARSVAGILVANTSPFRDIGATPQAALAAAAWRFNVVHLAHRQDDNYVIDVVRGETDAVKAAGFPLQRIERDGSHWDFPGAWVNGQAVPGTVADVKNVLLPFLNDGWQSP